MATPRPGVWGIDLGQCALKAIRLENVDGQITATAFDYIEHPKILSQPDADPDQLTREALEQFLSRNNLKGDTVVISVPGQSGLARFVKLPPVEEKKIADIVRFEAKQQIPFPLDEVVWDFQKIGSGVVSDGFALETEIGLFAMKRDMINRFMQHFADVNVDVHVIQMAPLGLCNFVTYDLLAIDPTPKEGEAAAEKKQCVVALDIGTDNSNLVITDGDKIIWQRPIPLGGNHFTRALTKDMKLTFAKAEHLKRNAVKSPDLKKILSALKPVLNDFVSEVQRSLGYFTNTHREAQIQYLIGLGNAFRLPGLQKYLQEKLQLEVRKLGKLERLGGDEVVNAPTFNENVLSFSVAYGLALQGLGLTRLQTNLLPHEIRTERMIKAKKPWAAAAAACLLIGIAGMAYGLSLEKQNLSNPKIAEAEKKVQAENSKATSLQAAYKAEEERQKKAEDDIRHLSAGVDERDNWTLLYRYIALALPRPDGKNLGPKVAELYNNEDAKSAYKKLQAKRFPKEKISAKDAALRDEYIKKHLIQVNIEAILPVYTDDLTGYFERLYKENAELPFMHRDDKAAIEAAFGKGGDKEKANLPKKGWVIEIRGYTYNDGASRFIQQTFTENLTPRSGLFFSWPKEAPDVVKGIPENVLKEMSKRIAERIGFVYIYKGMNEADRDPVPVPGQFKIIRTSYVRGLLGESSGGGVGGFGALDRPNPQDVVQPGVKGGGDGDKDKDKDGKGSARSGWRALGSTVEGGGAGGAPGAFGNIAAKMKEGITGTELPTGKETRPELDPSQLATRTEFIILFVWQEPFAADAPPTLATEDAGKTAEKKN
jgi:type IV pilus assembly protein PilM